jgi:hypothetical protein
MTVQWANASARHPNAFVDVQSNETRSHKDPNISYHMAYWVLESLDYSSQGACTGTAFGCMMYAKWQHASSRPRNGWCRPWEVVERFARR